MVSPQNQKGSVTAAFWFEVHLSGTQEFITIEMNHMRW